jgi:hypothetical protein
MIKLLVFCAMCGKEKTIKIDTTKICPQVELQTLINDANWIVQYNKPNFDIYCSKRCAL